jgi:G3E family GTPase
MTETGSRTDGRLPLLILGGFLGAGKSTWLRHQLYVRRFGRVHVLVNEAAEISVDDILLDAADRRTVLAGGCACCAGRLALRDALLTICNEQHRGDAQPVDRIVLETSGLADPAAIASILAEDPVLSRRLVLCQTLVLVDAVCGLDQLRAEPLARRQVEAADALIVTKTALADLAELSRLSSTLRRLAPGSSISFHEFGEGVDVVLDERAEAQDLPEIASEPEPMIATELQLQGQGNWATVSVWLSALLANRGDQIARVKGIVDAPAGRLLLQSVRNHMQPPALVPLKRYLAYDQPSDFIIVIGRGLDPIRLSLSWRRFVQGQA